MARTRTTAPEIDFQSDVQSSCFDGADFDAAESVGIPKPADFNFTIAAGGEGQQGWLGS